MHLHHYKMVGGIDQSLSKYASIFCHFEDFVVRIPIALCSKSERKAQKTFFAGRGSRTHAPWLARRMNWSLRPLGHRDMLRFEEQFEVLN